jgi:hypothetical protein
MNTMIQKNDGSFDVDLGVYFDQKPNFSPTKMQSFVFDAVKNHTNGGAQHLKKCIRVNYTGEFNVDLPVYYQDLSGQTYLAVKDSDWVKDDPEKFVNWVNQNRKLKEIDYDRQLIRVIKYLKRWANILPFKTPSGVTLTVWACKYFSAYKNRDDWALYNTIDNMFLDFNLYKKVYCYHPVEPYDDLLSNLNSNQIYLFMEELKKFRNDIKKALYAYDIKIAELYVMNNLGIEFI